MTPGAAKFRWIAGALALLAVAGCSRSGSPARIALGYISHVVCGLSERLVIVRFGTTYDLRMAMIDICRLTADTVAALRATAGGATRTTPPHQD